MASGMSRRDQLVIQFILWLAIGTFLFGIWVIVVGLRKQPPSAPSSSNSVTNVHPSTGSTN